MDKHPVYYDYSKRNIIAEKVMNLLYPNGIENTIKTGLIQKEYSPLLNAYSITRAMIQSNESCNKIWATMELLHGLANKRTSYLCDTFDVEFTGGTIIPILYYAQVAALTSLMSVYGSVSIRDAGASYNLVRTKKGWRLDRRERHIRDLLGIKAHGKWHEQIRQIIEGLMGMEQFPQINVSLIEELEKERLKRHYEILGEVDAKLSRGIDEYFKFLPHVLGTTSVAIYVIDQICGRQTLSGIDRYNDLVENLETLFDEYSKDFSVVYTIQFALRARS
jgi:hypothetical protein